MAIALPTFKPQLELGAKNTKINELSLPIPNTKVQFVLEEGMKTILIRNREIADLKFNFDNGSENFTIPRGTSLELTNLYLVNKSIYMEATKASVVEILQLF